MPKHKKTPKSLKQAAEETREFLEKTFVEPARAFHEGFGKAIREGAEKGPKGLYDYLGDLGGRKEIQEGHNTTPAPKTGSRSRPWWME